MGERGVLVGRGSFRVDREAALKKLAAFQLDADDLFTPWVRLAVERGAKGFELDLKGKHMTLRFDGRPLDRDALRDPLSAVLVSERRRPDLAYWVAARMGLDRFLAKTAVSSGAGRTVVFGVVRNRSRFERARAGLVGRLALCPVEVRFEGRTIGGGGTGGLECRHGRRRYLISAAPRPWESASRLSLCVHGVLAQTVERRTPWACVEAVVRDDGLPLDAGFSRVVEGRALEAACESLGPRIRLFLLREARLQCRESAALASWLAEPELRPAWAGRPHPETGTWGRLLERFLGARMPSRGPYESLWEARRRVRWLRACIPGRLSSYASDSRDRARRALWHVPLFPDADGGWLSYRQLTRFVECHGAVGMADAPRRRGALTASVAAQHPGSVPAAKLLWRACRDDAEDLGKVLGAEAVRKVR